MTMAQFRNLSLRAQALGRPDGDLNAELTARDLVRLGYDEPEAAHIAALLLRERELERYLAAAEREQIMPLTRISVAYPTQLAKKLGTSCPPVLYCKGDLLLLQADAIAVVGSRKLNDTGRRFAARAGALCAREGYVLVTGGAEGADQTALEACLENGGSVIVFTAGRLCDCKMQPRVLYVSESGWTLPFSTPRAMSRNRLIHAMGEKTLIAQTGFGAGGTWNGTLDNLRHAWSPVFVHDDGSEGARALIARGAESVGMESLTTFTALTPRQQCFL